MNGNISESILGLAMVHHRNDIFMNRLYDLNWSIVDKPWADLDYYIQRHYIYLAKGVLTNEKRRD